jgi:DNA polymerase III alpha subunit
VALTDEGLQELLMQGVDIAGLTAQPSTQVQQHNLLCRQLDHPEDQLVEYAAPEVPVAQWDADHQEQWFVPEPFNTINVLEWLLERCHTEDEQLRVAEEWILFEERRMEPVLRLLIYLIHHFRENNILWGVGRGSSVSSYSLYLIGVHKVNSILFDLDPREFLK